LYSKQYQKQAEPEMNVISYLPRKSKPAIQILSRLFHKKQKQKQKEEAPEPTPADTPRSSAWIVNPAVDVLFCCGGLAWIFFFVHFFFFRNSTGSPVLTTLALTTVVATHALSETHLVATLTRIYKTAESRKQFFVYTHWAALFFAALGLGGLFIPGFTPILAKIYLLWVAQHFTAQSYGLALLYCYKSKYLLTSIEKRILRTLMDSTALFAILRQFTYKEWNPDGFLAQHIPFWGPLPEVYVQLCMAVVVGSAVMLAGVIVKKKLAMHRLMPLPAILMIATGVLLFVLGRRSTGVLFLYAPAFFHGSQYIFISISSYLKELNDKKETAARITTFWQSASLRYAGFLLMGSLVIYIALPRILEEFGFQFGLSFATVFCAVSLHHFVTDQGIWKLRDPKVRKTLEIPC
jgi:hypothetical protein